MAAIELPAEPWTRLPTAAKRPARRRPSLSLPAQGPGRSGGEGAGRGPARSSGRDRHHGSSVTKLADIKYVYVRSWGDGERVFKIVSFYLLRYESERIDNISEDMRIEVARAKWVRLDEAPKLLAYRGEKQMASRRWSIWRPTQKCDWRAR